MNAWKTITLVMFPLWLGLATKVFYPHLWGWPLVAIFSIAFTSAALIVPQFSRLKGSMPATVIVSALLTTILAVSFWQFWAGIPIVTAMVAILSLITFFFGKLASEEGLRDFGIGSGVVALIALNTIIVLSWAAGSDIRWSMSAVHGATVFILPFLTFSFLESFKESPQNS